MANKTDMVIGGVEVLVALGVSTLVGGAIAIVKPAKLGLIKKIAVGVGGAAISCMASDGVINYVDEKLKSTVDQIKAVFKKKHEDDIAIEEDEDAAE